MLNSKFILILILLVAGIMHFIKPQPFLKIMPDYVPYHKLMVFASGIVEILGAFLLLFKQTQIFGAYLCIALFFAVFPANIEMAKDFYQSQNKYLWLAILRLPLQIILIWWAYQFTK